MPVIGAHVSMAGGYFRRFQGCRRRPRGPVQLCTALN